MKKLLPVLLLSLPLFFTACDKDDDPVTPPAEQTYMPVTANSTWNYQVVNKLNAAANFAFTLKATTRDSSTASGKTYRVFTNSAGANEYYVKSGTDYFQLASLTGLDAGLELLYLKDKEVGTSWSETKTVSLGGMSVPTTFTYTIEDKLASYAVGSLTFSNVLKVKVVLGVAGLPINSQKLEFYYAPNVGRVKSQIQLAISLAAVNISNETSLISYTIQP
jgi:hypothetical protein